MITFEEKARYFPTYTDEAIQWANDMNISSLSEEEVRQIWNENNWTETVAFEMSRNTNTPPDVLDEIAQRAASYSRNKRNLLYEEASDKTMLYVAQNPNTDIKTLDKMLSDISHENPLRQTIYSAIAGIKSFSYYRKILKSEELDNIKKAMARSEMTPSWVLKKLYKNPNLRADILSNPSCSQSLLMDAVKNHDSYFSHIAIKNPSILDTLITAAVRGDYNPLISDEVYGNPKISEDVINQKLEQLGKSPDTQSQNLALTSIINNPSVSSETLAKIARTPKFMDGINASDILHHPNFNYEVNIALAQCDVAEVRCMLARSEKISLKAVEAFSEDKDADVRHALAGNNKSVPSGILDKMIKNEFDRLPEIPFSDDMTSEQKRNGLMSMNILSVLAKNNQLHESSVRYMAEECQKRGLYSVASALASNRAIVQSKEAEDILVSMAEKDIQNRMKNYPANKGRSETFMALASNHSTSAESIERLLKCADENNYHNREILKMIANEAKLTRKSAEMLIDIADNSELLHKEDKADIYRYMAMNRTTPADILVTFTMHPDNNIKMAALGNPKTPEEGTPEYEKCIETIGLKTEFADSVEEIMDDYKSEKNNDIEAEEGIDESAEDKEVYLTTGSESQGDSTDDFDL